MNPTTPISPADRTRAVGRLRALTVRTALAGIAAVGGFGYLAALTYSGDKASATTAVTSIPAPTDGSSNSSSNSSSNTATATPSPTLQPATPAPTTSTARAHATTGGSG
jgi:hypothetical protein